MNVYYKIPCGVSSPYVLGFSGLQKNFERHDHLFFSVNLLQVGRPLCLNDLI